MQEHSQLPDFHLQGEIVHAVPVLPEELAFLPQLLDHAEGLRDWAEGLREL